MLDGGFFRSSISRAYYAAYCVLTGALERHQESFRHAQNNPGHEQLLKLTANNLDTRLFSADVRRELRRAVGELQAGREVADYIPRQPVGRDRALRMVRQASKVVSWIEERN